MSKKKKHSSTPRRLRYNQKTRLEQATKWIPTYEGKNIVQGYRKYYGVDLLCAIKELEMLGISIKDSYKKSVKNSIEANRKQKENRLQKQKQEEIDFEWEDETFAFIAGYTGNGVPFGITHEELNSLEEKE